MRFKLVGPTDVARRGCVAWFTGLSASGKTTLCDALATSLMQAGIDVVVLDGDVLRRTVCSDLGFSRADREENMRRIGALSETHAARGAIVLIAAIAPFRSLRAELKRAATVPFLEVFVDAPLQVCEQRDPKGLYRRVRAGDIKGFTGIDDIYEVPEAPDVHCRTAEETVAASCARVMAVLQSLRPELRSILGE